MTKTMTAQVYGCIRDADYAQAIRLLEAKLGDFPRSRPVLSLIAYCCYHNKEYARSAEFYETLTEICPDVEEYQVYYAQSLIKGGSYLDASRVAASAVTPSASHSQRLRLLQANAELEQGNLSAAKAVLNDCLEDDCETIIALATLDFREGRFAKALETYKIARQVMDDQPMLTFYIALCHYQLNDYDKALELVDEIIHGTEGSLSSESFLVEALNLKAAILHTTKQHDDAKTTLSHFDENLDTVTIHNDVVLNIEEDPSIGMQKLEFLLSNQPFPPETLSNLLTLYTSHGQHNLAAETFETNKHLAQELLPPDVYDYFCAVVMSLASPEEAISMLEAQTAQCAPKLRSGKKEISDQAINAAASVRPDSSRPATMARPTTAAERKGHRALDVATKEYEGILDRYIPTLMLQAKLSWDRKEYLRAEQILRKSADFCHDHDSWRMNMGHILFAQQGDKFEESIQHYECLIKNEANADLLKVPPVALANLCVAYIMTNQNEAAEDLIKTIEREEQRSGNDERNPSPSCSCIINLVIGTLYASKGNYSFGISRISRIKKNLCQDTWYYTKHIFLALASSISKMMYIMKDDTLQDILCFLNDAESNGKQILMESDDVSFDPLNPKKPPTVASEARQLKNIFLKICA